MVLVYFYLWCLGQCHTIVTVVLAQFILLNLAASIPKYSNAKTAILYQKKLLDIFK